MPAAGAGFAWALRGETLHFAGGLAADGLYDAAVHYAWDVAGGADWTRRRRSPPAETTAAGPPPAASSMPWPAATTGTSAPATSPTWTRSTRPTGLWTPRAPIPSARSKIGASTVALADGRILVVGGSLPDIVPSDDVFLYDPVADAWSSLPPLPEKRKGAVAAAGGVAHRRHDRLAHLGRPTPTTFVGCCLLR